MIDYNTLSQNDLNNALIDACQNGNLELTKYLVSSQELNQHADPSCNKWEAVKLAIEAGKVEIVKYFFTAIQNEYPNIIFNSACRTGQLEILKFLYSTPDYQDDKDGTCYYGSLIAVIAGHVNILDYYLTSPDLASFFKKTKIKDFLIAATGSGHVHILEYFLNQKDFSPIFFNNIDYLFSHACNSGHINVLEYLIKFPTLIQNNSLNNVCNKGIIGACENNQIEVINYLIFKLDLQLDQNTKEHLIGINRSDVIEIVNKKELEKKLSKDLAVNQCRQSNKNLKI